IFHVLQHHAPTVGSRFTLQLHVGHLTPTKFGFHDVSGAADLNGSLLHVQFTPFETVGLENHGRQCIPLFLAGGWVKRNAYPPPFFFRTPPLPRSPGEPFFGTCQVRLPGLPYTTLHRHIEFAMGVLGMLIEVAGAEQVATASFHVISFHLPRGLPWSRG